MPLLPRKNTLDYNPNSIIDASKKLTAIALERMKNPLEDPDQQTLSTMEATRSLDSSVANLDSLASVFHSTLLRIQNLTATKIRGSGRKGGAKGDLTPFATKEKARKDDLTPFARKALEAKEEKLFEDKDRWRAIYQDDDRNSEAKTQSTFGYLDDDSLPSFPDWRSESDNGIAVNVGGETDISWSSLIFSLINLTRQMDIIVVSRIKPVIGNLSQAQITRLNEIYTLVFNSYNYLVQPFSRRMANPKSKALTGEDYRDPYSKVLVNANPNVFQDYGFGDTTKAILKQNEYGDEILNTFNTERSKLCLDLTVVINSWKQNTPTGQQTEFGNDIQQEFNATLKKNKDLMVEVERDRQAGDDAFILGAGRKPRKPRKTGQMTLVGNGRNFYGEKVNESRDLPCLLSSIRNCPTKYML